jgi:hypothetical protein
MLRSLVRRMARKRTTPEPDIAVVLGSDGFPLIAADDGTGVFAGRQKRKWPTHCPVCFSAGAYLGVAKSQCIYLYCTSCGCRVFSNSPRCDTLLRAWHRTLKNPEAREHLTQLLATQVDS